MTEEETSATPREPSLSWHEERARCAYHEAGHAVVAHLLGRSLIEVSIMPSFGRRFGRRHPFGYCKYEALSSASISIEEEIILCFAGGMAEGIICGRSGWTYKGWQQGWYDDDSM